MNSVGLIVWIITILIFAGVLFFAGETLFERAGALYKELIQEGATDQTDALGNLDGDEPKPERTAKTE